MVFNLLMVKKRGIENIILLSIEGNSYLKWLKKGI